jgi:hypothetical protein
MGVVEFEFGGAGGKVAAAWIGWGGRQDCFHSHHREAALAAFRIRIRELKSSMLAKKASLMAIHDKARLMLLLDLLGASPLSSTLYISGGEAKGIGEPLQDRGGNFHAVAA